VRLERYELVRRLGRGGMADIYLARSRAIHGIEKRVVLKLLRKELAVDDQFVHMFLDEARLAMALHHANIVQVFDVGEEDGVVFYAMEHLHGHDVRDIITAAPDGVPLDFAVAIGVGMCAGLHHAHDMVDGDGEPLEIVHRDVSPHNVFATYDGVVKLIDFGIARAANRLSQTTQHGVLKGKFGYMSPEQCLLLPLDRRSDIFAASIVLWELTTGRRLFGGRSEYEVLKRVVELDAEAPERQGVEYPRELARIVLRGLQRDPAARYATAAEMQHELERFASAAGLSLSQSTITRTMERLFPNDVAAWRGGVRTPVATPTLEEPIETRSAVVTESAVPRPAKNLRTAIVVGAIASAAVAAAVLSQREEQIATAAKGIVREQEAMEAPTHSIAESTVTPQMSASAPRSAPPKRTFRPRPTSRKPPDPDGVLPR